MEGGRDENGLFAGKPAGASREPAFVASCRRGAATSAGPHRHKHALSRNAYATLNLCTSQSLATHETRAAGLRTRQDQSRWSGVDCDLWGIDFFLPKSGQRVGLIGFFPRERECVHK